ncbi:hypothetical protein C8J56DRAFT_279719 [Mycena floridula]|nr:hypothetical protein C8J56DRAFT_279719 [Mycena floridula]
MGGFIFLPILLSFSNLTTTLTHYLIGAVFITNLNLLSSLQQLLVFLGLIARSNLHCQSGPTCLTHRKSSFQLSSAKMNRFLISLCSFDHCLLSFLPYFLFP